MATTFPTRFDSVLDLARLPWFEVRGGNRLELAADAADEVGPVIDMHTHLAMGFVRRLKVDLHAATPTTAYYLPLTSPSSTPTRGSSCPAWDWTPCAR